MNNPERNPQVTRPHVSRVRARLSAPRQLNWRIVILFVFLTPVLLCSCSLLFYVIFPQPQTNILVLGVDSREGEGWLTRADSIMLVGVNPRRLQVSLMSIPRDLSISVPDYGLQRINTVNVLGEMEQAGRGPALTAIGIQESFGVQSDRYVRLDFNGFVDLINAVGGVTIDVEYAIVDSFYPTEDYGTMTVRFDPGIQYMDGERALQYARTRYSDDDYRRAGRQQQVVSALAGKLINPIYWPGAVAALNRNVDTDLGVFDLLRLGPPVIFSAGRFEQLVIDREYITATAEGVVVPDYSKITPWLAGRFN